MVHAVIQEYILDKLNRRMHLSKVKHSKFNESGQLLAFYATSAVWEADIIIRKGREGGHRAEGRGDIGRKGGGT